MKTVQLKGTQVRHTWHWFEPNKNTTFSLVLTHNHFPQNLITKWRMIWIGLYYFNLIYWNHTPDVYHHVHVFMVEYKMYFDCIVPKNINNSSVEYYVQLCAQLSQIYSIKLMTWIVDSTFRLTIGSNWVDCF